MKTLTQIIPCLALASAATVASGATILLDFETPNQFTDNFRVIHTHSGSGTIDYGLTSGSAIKSGTTATTNWLGIGNGNNTSNILIAAYDTTPLNSSDAAQTFGSSFTVSFNVSSPSGGTFGFYLFDPTSSNNGNNLWATFEIDASAGHERIRFGRDASMTPTSTSLSNGYTAGVTGVGGSFSSSYYQSTGSASAAVTTDNSSPFVFYKLTLEYTGDTLSFGYITYVNDVATQVSWAQLAIPEEDRIADAAVALYALRPYTGQVKIDDFSITTVPEPSSYALMAGALVGGLVLYRRKRRS